MQNFRNLSVWQLARRFTRTVYERSADFPRAEEFGLNSEMRRAAVSICANIAEGCGWRGDAEFRHFPDIAMGSACELEFIAEPVHDPLLSMLVEIKRMLGGLISTVSAAIDRSRSRAGKDHKRSRTADAVLNRAGSRQLKADSCQLR